MKTMHERLAFVRKQVGFQTAKAFAEHHGLQYATYLSHESGDRGFMKNAEKYADLLNCSLNWLITGEGSPLQTPEETKKSYGFSDASDSDNGSRLHNKFPDTYGKIPVLGYASGSGEKAAINWDYDAPIAWVDAPPALAGVPKASALMYTGDSMYPRYRDGDIIILNRALQPKAGQDCVFDTTDGETHVKVYIRSDHEFFYFQQYNPEKEIKYSRRDIAGIYAVSSRV